MEDLVQITWPIVNMREMVKNMIADELRSSRDQETATRRSLKK